MDEKLSQLSLLTSSPAKRLPAVHEQVRAVSPGPHVASYRLLLFREDGDALLIPARGQEPLRLQPFDYPPGAPQGSYHVEFYDASGRVIPPPSEGPPRITIRYESAARETPKPIEAQPTAPQPESKSLTLRQSGEKAISPAAGAEAGEQSETEVTLRTPADFRQESMRQDLELRGQRLDSHKILHEYFRGMAETLTELRTLTAHWGKEELQERFEMQKLLLAQGKATLEMQAQAAATIRAQVENLEPPKPLVDLTVVATTLITAVQTIWTSSLLRSSAKSPAALMPAGAEAGDAVLEELMSLANPLQFQRLLHDPAKAQEIKVRLERIIAENEKPAASKAESTASSKPPEPAQQETATAAPSEESTPAPVLTDEQELDLAIAAETSRALKAELTQLNVRRVQATSDTERLRLLEEINTKTKALLAFQTEYKEKLEQAHGKRGS